MRRPARQLNVPGVPETTDGNDELPRAGQHVGVARRGERAPVQDFTAIPDQDRPTCATARRSAAIKSAL